MVMGRLFGYGKALCTQFDSAPRHQQNQGVKCFGLATYFSVYTRFIPFSWFIFHFHAPLSKHKIANKIGNEGHLYRHLSDLLLVTERQGRHIRVGKGCLNMTSIGGKIGLRLSVWMTRKGYWHPLQADWYCHHVSPHSVPRSWDSSRPPSRTFDLVKAVAGIFIFVEGFLRV